MLTPISLVAEDLDLVERGERVDEDRAATGDHALLDAGTSRRQRVLDAVLLLLQLDLGGRADLEHRDATRQLGEALLELLAVEVAGRVLDLELDLADAAP